ncbi:MBL fold metallo-hydrolase [Alteribacillus sp. HJP-4]|uniref:MBL fold metallo-hydrolase n=1 Tax=Alteribacillus sp. HJP-4 TaxID=2775394 RepID=UPI0035CCCEF0
MAVQYEDKYVTVFQSALHQTTSTVAVTKDVILIVDPTWLPEEIAAIQEYVESVDEGQRKYLLFTHSDFDHIIGYNAFPEAVTIASRGFVARTGKKETMQELQDFDDHYYIQRPYVLDYPRIDIIIDYDEQIMEIGDTKLTFYLAPGHTPDGTFLIINNLKVLICGDYLSDVEFPFITHTCSAYERTLKKLETVIFDKEIELVIPGHGTATTELKEMRDRIEDSRWYLEALKKEAVSNEDYDVLQAFVDSFLFSRFLSEKHNENREVLKKELEREQAEHQR